MKRIHCKSVCLFVFVCRAVSAQQTPSPALPEGSINTLTLGDAEELLMKRNQLVVVSRYQVEVSESMRRIAGYKQNPVLHIGAEQVPIQSPVPGSAPRLFATNSDAGANPVYTASLIKVIERGGKRELRVQQADAVTEANRAQVLDAFRLQLFQLRQAFTAAILAKENLRLAETIDLQYAETERLTEVRVKGGDLAGVELIRARAGRLPYKQAILDTKLAYQQAVRDALNLLNLRPGESIPAQQRGTIGANQVPGALRDAVLIVLGQLSDKPIVKSLDELRGMALRDRPDAVAVRSGLKAADRAVALAEAQRKRDVSVSVEYQRVGEDHTLGVVSEIPLFLYNNQKAGISLAVAQKRIAESQLRLIETQVVTDVEKAYQTYLTARQSVAIYADDGVQEAARLRDVVEYSYRRGEASLFELLDAQRTLNQASLAYNQARANYQLALWQMENAIGGPLE